MVSTDLRRENISSLSNTENLVWLSPLVLIQFGMIYFGIYYVQQTVKISKIEKSNYFDKHTFATLILLAAYCFSKSVMQAFSDVCMIIYYSTRVGDANDYVDVNNPNLEWPETYHRWFLVN